MKRRIFLSGGVGLLGSGVSWAQTDFDRDRNPVHILSTLPSGSGPDVVLRILAEKLQSRWSRSVVVEPRPGGAGAVAINAMKHSAANGSKMVLVDVGNLSINPLIFRHLSYDPDKDLVPVAILYKTAFFIVVAANGPYRTFKDLLAAAKETTRSLRYGSNGVGSPIHLSSARLEEALGSTMLHVPYKESAQMYAAVATGELDWAFGSPLTTLALVQAGKLRLLAVADRLRFSGLPEVPTMEEAGGPGGIFAQSWTALMASRGTPVKVAQEINAAVNDVLAQPDVRSRLAGFGFVVETGSVQQVLEWTIADRQRYAEVLKRIKVEMD